MHILGIRLQQRSLEGRVRQCYRALLAEEPNVLGGDLGREHGDERRQQRTLVQIVDAPELRVTEEGNLVQEVRQKAPRVLVSGAAIEFRLLVYHELAAGPR